MADTVFCPVCDAPMQRLMDPRSTPLDGLEAHLKRCHPEYKLVPGDK